MATIIDGTTYNGYWKITPSDGSPNVYYVIQKDKILFESSDTAAGFIKDLSGNNVINVGTDANTEDVDGNALDTSAKVATYLSNNR